MSESTADPNDQELLSFGDEEMTFDVALEKLEDRGAKITPLVLALEWDRENPEGEPKHQGVDWLRALISAYEELAA